MRSSCCGASPNASRESSPSCRASTTSVGRPAARHRPEDLDRLLTSWLDVPARLVIERVELANVNPWSTPFLVAILVFGGLWGFWGVFFAIPLATLVQAVLKAWPQSPHSIQSVPADPVEEPRRSPRSPDR